MRNTQQSIINDMKNNILGQASAQGQQVRPKKTITLSSGKTVVIEQ